MSASRRRVYLHIGAPKTGTTYVQDRLSLNAKALAAHGVHVPTRSPLVSPALFHFRAALDLQGQDWGGDSGHAAGAWDQLVRRVHRARGTVIVSHEILAPAKAPHVARALADLGRDAEVHVVYSARDLARQLPAAWQESIKQGRTWSYRRFLRRSRRGRTWFARSFDLPTVLGRWGADLPPERVHLVTVPQRGVDPAAHGGSLWERFCAATGVDPAWAPEESGRRNPSLGVPETALLRRLNRTLDRRTRREGRFDVLVRDVLAERDLAQRDSVPLRLPPSEHDWIAERTQEWIDWVGASGVRVHGSLDDLRPVPTDPASYADPARVRPKQQLRVAVAALSAMTQEAARREDPDRTWSAKVRKQAERLRSS